MKGKTLIKIQGHLDRKWQDSFEGLRINYKGPDTILETTIKDSAHLHGILNLVRDLNLRLISVNPADDNNEHSI